MNILAIETATEYCSVALQSGPDLLRRHEHAPRKHAELLLPWIEQLLAEAGLSLRDLDAIAYGRGPGSFTSLRLGIGVVQGLAFGAGLGVCGVSSLAALAQSSRFATSDNSILVATDARMQEVFTGCFEVAESGLVTAMAKEVVAPPSGLPLPAGPSHGVGNGFSSYNAALMQRLEGWLLEVDADCWPDASSVIRLAEPLIAGGDIDAPEAALPVYVRNRVAEKPA